MYIVYCLIILALVTYLPRALPLAFIKKKIENRFIQSFLYYVPYAVLACMTFPAIFSVTSNNILSAIGAITAIVLSFFIKKFYIVSILSIMIVYACSFMFY